MNYFLAVILLKTSDMPSNIHCLRHTRSGGPIVYHTPTQLAMLSEEKLHVFPYVLWFFYNKKRSKYLDRFGTEGGISTRRIFNIIQCQKVAESL